MSKFAVGQPVWVCRTLKEGIFLKKIIHEVENGFGREINYYLSNQRLKSPYHEADLVSDVDEAKEICLQALKKNMIQAKSEYDTFAKKEILWQTPESSLAW